MSTASKLKCVCVCLALGAAALAFTQHATPCQVHKQALEFADAYDGRGLSARGRAALRTLRNEADMCGQAMKPAKLMILETFLITAVTKLQQLALLTPGNDEEKKMAEEQEADMKRLIMKEHTTLFQNCFDISEQDVHQDLLAVSKTSLG